MQVVVRVRPPLLPYERDAERVVSVSDGREVTVRDGSASWRFTFDRVFGEHSTQDDVYGDAAAMVVRSVCQDGYNATILAYGQTGTGKTYTMEDGVTPRAVADIPFDRCEVRASFLQLYNERVADLLKPDRARLAIREDPVRGIFVEGLSEWLVQTPDEVLALLRAGSSERVTGETSANSVSSRSHAIFTLVVDGAKLNLVDLAGSERLGMTRARGQRLEEGKKINKSLSALCAVIAALTDTTRDHVPFRDSKLTRLLSDALGGNSKTVLMAMIAPTDNCLGETLSTLKFANRAKHIRNTPVRAADATMPAAVGALQAELEACRARQRVLEDELEEKSDEVLRLHRRVRVLEEEQKDATSGEWRGRPTGDGDERIRALREEKSALEELYRHHVQRRAESEERPPGDWLAQEAMSMKDGLRERAQRAEEEAAALRSSLANERHDKAFIVEREADVQLENKRLREALKTAHADAETVNEHMGEVKKESALLKAVLLEKVKGLVEVVHRKVCFSEDADDGLREPVELLHKLVQATADSFL